MIFSLTISLIESILFSCFIAYYFHYSSKKTYIFYSVFAQMVLHYIHIYFHDYGMWFTLGTILVMLLSVFMKTKKMTFLDFYIVVVYESFVIVLGIFSVIITNIFMHFDIHISYYLIDVFQRVIQALFTFGYLKRCHYSEQSTPIKNWKSIVSIQMLLLLSVGIEWMNLQTSLFSKFMVLIDFILVISILTIFVHTVYYYNYVNQKLLEEKKKEQLALFQQQKLSTFRYLKDEIERTEHRLLYHLNIIENAIVNHDDTKALKILKQYKERILKMTIRIHTQNPIFDNVMSSKLSDMQKSGIDIKLMITIEQHVFYDDLSFLNTLTTILDSFYHYQSLSISIVQINQFVKVTIDDLEQPLSQKHIKQFQHLDYSLTGNGICFLFDMGEDI